MNVFITELINVLGKEYFFQKKLLNVRYSFGYSFYYFDYNLNSYPFQSSWVWEIIEFKHIQISDWRLVNPTFQVIFSEQILFIEVFVYSIIISIIISADILLNRHCKLEKLQNFNIVCIMHNNFTPNQQLMITDLHIHIWIYT